MEICTFSPNIINFNGEKQSKHTPKTKTEFAAQMSDARNLMANYAMAILLMAGSPAMAQTLEPRINSNTIEEVAQPAKFRTELSGKELDNAPSPIINIAGKEVNAGIVVDIKNNKLYRYNEDGSVIDGYKIASGVIGRNGRSITHTGLRQVDHIETAPYENAYGTKRKRYPKDYGPKILYLTIVNPKTGNIEGSNGEFIHGTRPEWESKIGQYVSHGCMRMENEVIKKLAQEVKPGTYVDIRN